MRFKNCGTFLNGVIIYVIFTINEYCVSVGCKQNYFPMFLRLCCLLQFLILISLIQGNGKTCVGGPVNISQHECFLTRRSTESGLQICVPSLIWQPAESVSKTVPFSSTAMVLGYSERVWRVSAPST